jgi:hypothetical protein
LVFEKADFRTDSEQLPLLAESVQQLSYVDSCRSIDLVVFENTVLKDKETWSPAETYEF